MMLDLAPLIGWLAGTALGVYLMGRYDLDDEWILVVIFWPLALPLLALMLPFVWLYKMGERHGGAR